MLDDKFRRLGLFYFLALGCIALTITLSQAFIQSFIGSQQYDSRTINIAGRQRMLSQKITKDVLVITQQISTVSRESIDQLENDLDLWEASHEGLQLGDEELGLEGNNSQRIKELFHEISFEYQQIRSNSRQLIDKARSGDFAINKEASAILSAEDSFLKGMNDVVFQYDLEASLRVARLKRLEYFLYGISLLIVLLEILFIFMPLARKIRANMRELEQSEKKSKLMASELSQLYEELEKSYQDLEAVSLEPESPSIFARMDKKGRFIFVSDHFMIMLEYPKSRFPKNLEKLLTGSGYKKDFSKNILQQVSQGRSWSGQLRLLTDEGDFCWIEGYLVPVGDQSDIKFVAHDVTEIKEARMKSREITKERIDKMVQEQSYRSSLILQGQEEERKRLSQELHDGVGQMLSAMKLSLEAISPSDSRHMRARLDESRDLMKSIIREIRRVSFNLTPSSLDDFGLVAAVKKFCDDIDRFSTTKVAFHNHTNFVNRLVGTIETSLYRIIQEAVNNALKYADAKNIDVTFEHKLDDLTITIADNGKGFSPEEVNDESNSSPGHGLFNMRERASFIGGKLKVTSRPKEGTQIHIKLALKEYDKSNIG